MEISVAEMIDRGIEKWGERDESEIRPQRKAINRNPFYFRASEIGQCMARLSYQWQANKPKAEVPALHRMYAGEVWGRELAGLLETGRNKQDIISVETEVYMKKKFEVAFIEKRRKSPATIEIDGHCDIVLTLKNGIRVPIEIKSMGQLSFMALLRDGKPYDEHDSQIRTYMALLGVSEGILLARRMDGPMQEFVIRHDENEWREILNRCLEVGFARQNEKIAPREYQPGEPPCTYCPFAEPCWGTSHEDKTRSGSKNPPVIPLRGELLQLKTLAERKKELEKKAEEIKGKFSRLGEEVLSHYKANVLDAEDRDGRRYRLRKTFVSQTRETVPDEFKKELRKQKKLIGKEIEFSYITMKV